MRHKLMLLVVAGVLGAAGGWAFNTLLLSPSSTPVQAGDVHELIGQRRPEFSLGSTTGAVLQADDFDGKVVLVNFWATWCKPCREEMPMLSELRERLHGQGFEVLGIALDDVQQAREFLDELDINYPNAVGTVDVIAVSAAYGNRAGMLPYSVLLDRDGIIRWNVLGEVSEAEISALIEELL